MSVGPLMESFVGPLQHRTVILYTMYMLVSTSLGLSLVCACFLTCTALLVQGDTWLPERSGDVIVRKALQLRRDTVLAGHQPTVGAVLLDIEANRWCPQDDQESAWAKDMHNLLEFFTSHQWSWMSVTRLKLKCQGRFRALCHCFACH